MPHFWRPFHKIEMINYTALANIYNVLMTYFSNKKPLKEDNLQFLSDPRDLMWFYPFSRFDYISKDLPFWTVMKINLVRSSHNVEHILICTAKNGIQ